MLKAEEVKEVFMKELELKNWFPDQEWEDIYPLFSEYELNEEILSNEENLKKFLNENKK